MSVWMLTASVDPNGTIFRMNSRMSQKVYPGPSWWVRSCAQGYTRVKRPLKLTRRMAALTSLQKMGCRTVWNIKFSWSSFLPTWGYGLSENRGIIRVPKVDGILIILTSTLQFRGQKLGAVHSWAGTEPEISETNRLAAGHGCLKPLRKIRLIGDIIGNSGEH